MISILDKDYNKLVKEVYKLNPKEQTDLDDQRVIGDIFNINEEIDNLKSRMLLLGQ